MVEDYVAHCAVCLSEAARYVMFFRMILQELGLPAGA